MLSDLGMISLTCRVSWFPLKGGNLPSLITIDLPNFGNTWKYNMHQDADAIRIVTKV